MPVQTLAILLRGCDPVGAGQAAGWVGWHCRTSPSPERARCCWSPRDPVVHHGVGAHCGQLAVNRDSGALFGHRHQPVRRRRAPPKPRCGTKQCNVSAFRSLLSSSLMACGPARSEGLARLLKSHSCRWKAHLSRRGCCQSTRRCVPDGALGFRVRNRCQAPVGCRPSPRCLPHGRPAEAPRRTAAPCLWRRSAAGAAGAAGQRWAWWRGTSVAARPRCSYGVTSHQRKEVVRFVIRTKLHQCCTAQSKKP